MKAINTFSNEERKMTDAMSRAALRILKHPASDDITVSVDDCRKFNEMFQLMDVNSSKSVPADILIAKTLPISDTMIHLKDGTSILKPSESGRKVSKDIDIRVCMTDDWRERIDDIPEGMTLMCGFIAVRVPGYDMWSIVELGVSKDDSSFRVGLMAQIENGQIDELGDISEKVYNEIRGAVGSYLSFWYVVQVALLHPQIREIIGEPKKVPVQDESRKAKKDKKRKTVYVRKYRINAKTVSSIMAATTETRNFKRHCLCWYVIGHWRYYKSGKAVFVNGYWKGELRDLKRNIDEGRDREVKTA